MRDSTKARYLVVGDKPSLHFIFFDHGELNEAQRYADSINGVLIKAADEGVDVEFVHTLTCDPEAHKLAGVPMKKLSH